MWVLWTWCGGIWERGDAIRTQVEVTQSTISCLVSTEYAACCLNSVLMLCSDTHTPSGLDSSIFSCNLNLHTSYSLKHMKAHK